MASQNEVYKLLGRALLKSKFLDNESSVAQGSSGAMYLRLGAQVFRIEVDEVDEIQSASDPFGAAERFMESQPHPYGEND